MKSRVITVRGMTKEIKYGSLKKGGFGNPSITKEVTYYKDEYDGKVMTEIDKWNPGCVINGVNIGKEIQDLI
jgi:P2 family phage contractile tail tube protein